MREARTAIGETVATAHLARALFRAFRRLRSTRALHVRIAAGRREVAVPSFPAGETQNSSAGIPHVSSGHLTSGQLLAATSHWHILAAACAGESSAREPEPEHGAH